MSLPPVFTLTGNLLCEHTLDFADWAPGRTQRATAASFQVGGKGINVTRMLARLGTSATALYFPGGATGEACTRWLTQGRLPHHAFPTSATTRLGVVVRGGAHAETTFLGPDTPPDANAIHACADFLDAQPAGAILALAGSLPGWNSASFDPLRDALRRWTERSPLLVDTYGPPLAWLVELPLALVKINRTEFDALLAPASGEPSLAVRLAVARERWSASAWIVTHGSGSVWAQSVTGPACEFTPPSIREISPTGSGDVLLACFLHAHYVLGRDLLSALQWALPFASANAAHAGVAEFPLPART